MFGGDDIDAVIMGGGITFRGGPKKEKNPREAEKVKTKAKKKQYITGAHGSGAAKKKADIRRHTRRLRKILQTSPSLTTVLDLPPYMRKVSFTTVKRRRLLKT